jgi:hypothetical protein
LGNFKNNFLKYLLGWEFCPTLFLNDEIVEGNRLDPFALEGRGITPMDKAV